MRVLIIGCGRVGSRLAIEMSDAGHEVTIIDWKADSFSRLGEGFQGNAIVGNGIDEDMLKRAGIEKADAFAAVTNGDNRNIMAAQIAQRLFKVPHVVCRIYDPIRNDVYSELGLKTLCPTTTGATALRKMILED
ncbi:MAG: potassium channel family protein [Candidatus Dormibacteraceae bacterium]